MTDVSASYARLGEVLRVRQRKMKLEMAVVSLLWLVGCPVLCLLLDTDSLYGTPEEGFCGLVLYSISASMTGHYSKILGSIMAPTFAVLVLQRTSGGLCSCLKLALLTKFSPLVTNKVQDENTRLLAQKLWDHIAKIELLGYFSASCLIALVAFDSKKFPLSHVVLASIAFFSLCQQNRMVGTLEEDFKEMFPNWSNKRATRMFRWGMMHLYIMYIPTTLLGFVHGFGRCNVVAEIVDSMSQVFSTSPATTWKLVSAVVWFNEYAFAFLCIYVQLLEHYEIRLWEIVGAANMPYMGIVSRFSIWAAIEWMIMGGASETHVFLGINTRQEMKSKTG